MKIINIKQSCDKTPTLDIEVENLHSYVLDNNCIVHNSSISCSLSNSIYPVRDLTLTKTAGDSANKWVAPEATRLSNKYEIAWDISNEHHINNYAIWQIFMDQSISSDTYLDRTSQVNVSIAQLYKELAQCAKLGIKSLYYLNTLTDKKETFEFLKGVETQEEQGCGSGGCTL